jgi:chloramphenicol 3-O-phosphotransferase
MQAISMWNNATDCDSVWSVSTFDLQGENMKNILLFGSSRSGKTTLAKRLQKEFGLNIVSWDILIHAFAWAFPQLEINFNGIFEQPSENQTSKNITPFVAHYLCELARHAKYKTGSNFVSDMSFFDFDEGVSLMEKRLRDMGGLKLHDEFLFIHLDNNRTSDEMFREIRQYDTEEDWTFGLSDAQLQNMCDELTKINPIIDAKINAFNCSRYGIAQGRERAFDKIANDLRMKFI